jgi:hypothetical protein
MSISEVTPVKNGCEGCTHWFFCGYHYSVFTIAETCPCEECLVKITCGVFCDARNYFRSK